MRTKKALTGLARPLLREIRDRRLCRAAIHWSGNGSGRPRSVRVCVPGDRAWATRDDSRAMSPIRRRRKRRSEREREARQARRDQLSARLRGEEPEAADAARKERRAERSAARETRPARKPRQATAQAARKAQGEGGADQGRTLVGEPSPVAPASSFEGARRAWRRGLRSTGARARRAGPALRRASRRGWALVAPLFGFVLGLVARAERLLRAALTGAWASPLRPSVRRLDRLLTPLRGAFLVTIASAGCLVLSQFVYYRGVEIGQPGYGQVSADRLSTAGRSAAGGRGALLSADPARRLRRGDRRGRRLRRRRRAAELFGLAGLAGLAVPLLSTCRAASTPALPGSASPAPMPCCGRALRPARRIRRPGHLRRGPLARSGRRALRGEETGAAQPAAGPGARSRKAPSLAESGT